MRHYLIDMVNSNSMPGRISRLEQNVDGINMKEILNWIKQQGRSYSGDKGGELVVDNQAA
jgi:hypothetical protein